MIGGGHRLSSACLSALLLFLSHETIAQADEACSVPPQGFTSSQLAQFTAEPQETLDWLMAQQDSCLKLAAYHRLIGRIYTQLGQLSQAIESTERALLHEPDHPETMIDYALLLARSGDTIAAQALFNQVFTRPDAPPYANALYQTLIEAVSNNGQTGELVSMANHDVISKNTSADSSRWMLTQSVGRSTNLNGATTATEITLTLPQGSITLPIAQSGRVVGGTQIQSQMMWSKAIQHEGDAWVGSAAITHRHTVPVQARTTQTDFAATWLQNTASPTHYLALAAAQLVDQGGSPRSRGFKLALGHEWRHPLAQDCRITALAEYTLTRQPASATENGRYKGISLGQVCQHNFGVLWRGGQDTPQHEARPGGVQYKSEWVIQGRANWAHARQTLTYTHTTQRDASGYSPLLSLGAARRLTRHALQMEWTQPLTPGKGLVGYKTAWSPSHWFVAFDGSVQRSNLALFSTRSATVSIGLKWDGR